MANVVEHKKFVFTSAGLNSNKVWEILLYDNNDVEVRYGRIGKGLQSKVHSGAGRKKMDSLIKEKTKASDHYDGGCYREIEVLDAATPVKTVPAVAAKHDLKQIAASQIATCPLTQKLVAFFTDINAHNIYQATGGQIKYDVSAGTFRTPIGIVTKGNVDKARTLLDKLTDFVTKIDFNRPFITTLEDYLMLIPQDVGRKFDPRTFCGDLTAIQNQSLILDGLEASIAAVMSTGKDEKGAVTKAEQPKLFDCRLSLVDDKKTLAELDAFYRKSAKHYHESSRLKLKTAYAVDMATMKSGWEKDGSRLDNIWKLWHGTKASNCLSLLKQGYIVPPASASYCVGRAFGNGIYFADCSTKSLNYAMTVWKTNAGYQKDEGRYFMFLNLVAMGRTFLPKKTFQGGCPSGYDSTYYDGKSDSIDFKNPEMVVYRQSQILPTHLIEFA